MKTMKPVNKMLPEQRFALPRQIRPSACAALAVMPSAFLAGHDARRR
ncbi:hypothetical protein L3V59_41240 [Burkholderia aenigmatica]|nr:hypothetical protein [Burkholderia aenigmatica]UKD17076.1 hypothetical protein L3V59_41240 [Burkholderia aenigmatica]